MALPGVCLLSFTSLACVLQVLGKADEKQKRKNPVFLHLPAAQSVFLRSKRANNFFVEEFLQGNLERECHEERCSYEEAREYFEDKGMTDKFWDTYPNKDECKPNPCLHGGNCTKKTMGFHCSCPPPHHGITCQLEDPLNSRENERTPQIAPQVVAGGFPCPSEGPNVCHQLCTSTSYAFTCSCVAGFKLQSDGRSCLPEADFACGRLPISPQGASMCHHGHCPWQALLLGSGGTELCAGVLLGPRAVLTAASCLLQESDPQPSNFFIIAGATDKTMSVKAIHLHKRFVLNRHDNDLAFLELSGPLPLGPFLRHLCLPTKDFSENILMYSGRTALAASMNRHLDQKLIYLSLDECRGRLNVSLALSNKMFCVMGRTGKTVTKTVSRDRLRSTAPQCGGGLLSAMPLATVERGTAFLTGLLIVPPKGCQENGLVFTKVSRHLVWIRQHLEAVQSHDQTTEQSKRN
ncbi:protein Z, vitamin K-dependent plasma glycoprotein b isoform X1 [Syngnathus typhle]|uniref:protein Z, vitamin K-dependent plasma glycoprotein b isoform X1 n=1 Tax=Syngnathus typhle TaxID=161592 RepID=UPI002A6AA2C8|nr:protein Z, vitamin K-dependent plasma glycoprotein b isoform X1 [Syngnathus typhle]